jgi:hypothetical protein
MASGSTGYSANDLLIHLVGAHALSTSNVHTSAA